MLFEMFKQAAVRALDSPNIVVGTITFGGDDFILGIKNKQDIEIHEVTRKQGRTAGHDLEEDLRTYWAITTRSRSPFRPARFD